MMRELKVEDALIYLDQVKMEFSAKPEIYNEFLEIMKNFKAQEIDTPGVIRRVSNLFRGYNQLILGFNTFLPEGYKIELKDIEMIERERERELEAAAAAARAAMAKGGSDARGGLQGSPQLQHPNRSSSTMGASNLGPSGMGPSGMGPSGMGPSSMGPSNMGPSSMGPSGMGPSTMGPSGSGPHFRDPAGMGGNGPPPSLSGPHSLGGPGSGPAGFGLKPRAPRPLGAEGGPRNILPGHALAHRGASDLLGGGPLPHSPPRPNPALGVVPDPPSAVAGGGDPAKNNNGQPVEFDHAINYVTTIKKRFSEDPDTYKTFLEILHTYQREQRGIKTVLDQVSKLFRDHPDLLKEFTYFLPDAVQDQAKERLHRAAQQAEIRNRLASEKAAAEAAANPGAMPHGGGILAPLPGARRGTGKKAARGMKNRLSPPPTLAGDGFDLADHVRSEAKTTPKQRGRRAADEHFYVRSAEREFFERVKGALGAGEGGREKWNSFMKILALYAHEVLNRTELHCVAQQLLERHPDLLLDFKKLLQSRANMPKKGKHGGVAAQPWYGMAVSDVDFTQCRRCTPSYRALPQYFPRPPCSMRSGDDQKCLNDQWVSLPVGSEENYSFKHMRRNTFEETLFKCEDERFEMDMVIDSNASTIRVLEPLAAEIAALRAAEAPHPDAPVFNYKLDPRSLSRVHLNAISRIYGDHGAEITELLKRNPAGAITVVLGRLKQKDVEWRRARQELARQWKGLMEQNFHKSLDHRSFYFRTQDKRAIAIRSLITDIAEAHEQRVHGAQRVEVQRKDAALALLSPSSGLPSGVAGDGVPNPAMADAGAEEGPPSASPEGGAKAAAKAEKRAAAFADTSAAAAAAAAALTTRKDKQVPPFRIDFAGGEPDLWVPYGMAGDGQRFEDKDAFELVAYATECGNWATEDKVLMHNLWRDVLGPMLRLPRAWFDAAGLALSLTLPPSADLTGRQGVLSAQTPVTTPYGNGAVVMYRAGAAGKSSGGTSASQEPAAGDAMDVESLGEEIAGFYEVKLNYGSTAFLRPLLVSKIPTDPAMEDGPSAPSSPLQAFPSLQRITLEAGRSLGEPLPASDDVFIGTAAHYGFARLYALLQARLGVARGLAEAAKERKRKDADERVRDTGADPRVRSPRASDPTRLFSFPTVVSATYALINGGLDANAFEETCRQLLGNGAYVLYTIDKLVSQVIRHVHAMATEEGAMQCAALWRHATIKKKTPLEHLNLVQAMFSGRDDVLYKLHFATRGGADPHPPQPTVAPETAPEALAQPHTVLAMELLGTAQDLEDSWGKRTRAQKDYNRRMRAAEETGLAQAPPADAARPSAPFSTGRGGQMSSATMPPGGAGSSTARRIGPEGAPIAMGPAAPMRPSQFPQASKKGFGGMAPRRPEAGPLALSRPDASGASGAPRPKSIGPAARDGSADAPKMSAGAAAAAMAAGSSEAGERKLGGMFSLGLGLGLDHKKRPREEPSEEEPLEKKPKAAMM